VKAKSFRTLASAVFVSGGKFGRCTVPVKVLPQAVHKQRTAATIKICILFFGSVDCKPALCAYQTSSDSQYNNYAVVNNVRNLTLTQ